MVRVGGARVLQEVLDEEDVSRDALYRFYEEVVQTEFPFAVSSQLLRSREEVRNTKKVCMCVWGGQEIGVS